MSQNNTNNDLFLWDWITHYTDPHYCDPVPGASHYNIGDRREEILEYLVVAGRIRGLQDYVPTCLKLERALENLPAICFLGFDAEQAFAIRQAWDRSKLNRPEGPLFQYIMDFFDELDWEHDEHGYVQPWDTTIRRIRPNAHLGAHLSSISWKSRSHNNSCVYWIKRAIRDAWFEICDIKDEAEILIAQEEVRAAAELVRRSREKFTAAAEALKAHLALRPSSASAPHPLKPI
jgi:hypothetical protein